MKGELASLNVSTAAAAAAYEAVRQRSLVESPLIRGTCAW